MKTLFPLLLIAFVGVYTSAAQDANPISTDRPDYTESASSVGKGILQRELGASAFQHGAGSIWNVGEGLIRYGLINRVEVRVSLPDAMGGDELDTGFGDSGIALKAELGTIAKKLQMALIVSTSLPTGSDDYGSDGASPGFIIVAGTQLTERISLGSQFSAELMDQGFENVLSKGFTLVAGFPVSERVGGFTEIVAELTPDQDAQLQFHTGLTLSVNPDVQLDVHGGFGLTEFTPDTFFGLGVSIRR